MNYRQKGLTLKEYLGFMDQLRIPYSTLMPIPTSVKAVHSTTALQSSVVTCGCSPVYYLNPILREKKTICKTDLKEAVEYAQLYADTGVDQYTANAYNSLNREDRRRFDPMITGLHIGADDCSNKLLEKLNLNQGVFTGVGEITVHKEVVDKLIGRGWAHLKKNKLPLIQLLYTCGKIGMPVVLHCDIGGCTQMPEEIPKYLQELKDVFSHQFVSKTKIIWAHAGGLGRFVSPSLDHVEILREILQEFPNLHIDISWDLVADKVVVGGCAKQWIKLIEEFSDRFIFGSDTLVPTSADSWNTTFKKYEPLRDALTEETRRKVFLKNYEGLMLPARKAVRDYEATQLQNDLKTLDDDFRRELKAFDAARANGLSRPTTTTINSSTTTSSTTTSSSTNLLISTLSGAPQSDQSSTSAANTNIEQQEALTT